MYVVSSSHHSQSSGHKLAIHRPWRVVHAVLPKESQKVSKRCKCIVSMCKLTTQGFSTRKLCRVLNFFINIIKTLV